MRRRIIVTLLGATIMFVPATQALAYHAHYSHYQVRTCSFKRNSHWSHKEIKDTIRCVGRVVYPHVVPLATHIARRESGLTCCAQNPSSSAHGTLQYLSGTWQHAWGRFHNLGKRMFDRYVSRGRNNARSAVIIGILHMRHWGCRAWSASC